MEVRQENGDVKNPRAKENRRPNNNFLLRDLIRILIIRELLQGGIRPGMPGRPPIRRRPWRNSRRKTANNETSDIWEYIRNLLLTIMKKQC